MYNQGGVAGTSFIARPLTRGSGDAIGTSFIADCGGWGIRVLSSTFQSIQWCSHLHHLPAVEGRFLGWHGDGEERVPGRLWLHLGDLGPLLGESVRRRGYDGSRVVPGMSNTTGGRSARGMQQVAAVSGRAAPISRCTPGRAARGGVCAGPGLLLTAVRASL